MRVVYLLWEGSATCSGACAHARKQTYLLALIFLLLRLRRRTRFFLHLALIVNDWCCWWEGQLSSSCVT